MLERWEGVCPKCRAEMIHIGGSGTWECPSPPEVCGVSWIKLKRAKMTPNGPFMYVIDRIIYETVPSNLWHYR